jgi:uncharacterized protein
MNRLGLERSPYLLQHAGNPVDWYPWGDEAFEKARGENKPIFLSIGYSTCHWCHVMEHESFENDEVAQMLNASFVAVKVDREERPDVDRVYMAFVQSTTGSGGWPMSVFLTPELKPFFGGTYFPPTSRWGRPGFVDILQEISRIWADDRARVDFAAAELFDRLKSVAGADGRSRAESQLAGPETLTQAVAEYLSAFDRRNGGFSDAPKFPRPVELLFLLREYARGKDPAILDAVAATLRAMALGGMRDHVGGGFHRYSVDPAWRVPHFEKMLYDQAQLTIAFLEGAQATGQDFFAAVAEDTLAYVLRDMRDPSTGGFYSAEDADSLPERNATEKREGAFYVWSDAELRDVLGADADVARARFGIEPGGNAPQDPQGEFTGQNILYSARSLDQVAADTGRSVDDVMAALGRVRRTLFDVRATRPRPHLDDKILVSWNGLMIAALARAARVLPQSPDAGEWLDSARRAATFIRSTLWQSGEQRLLRRYRDGDAAIEAYAEDYACLIWGVIELFECEGDASWLAWARELQARQDALFWDPDEGGWFSTTGADPAVLLRLKEDYDGAEPAASSVSVMNELHLAYLLDDDEARQRAARTLARYGPRAGRAARVIPLMLAGLSAWHAGLGQVVVVGHPSDDATLLLRAELAKHYLPFAVVIPIVPGPGAEALARMIPFVRPMAARANPTAFVCQDFLCREPVSTAAALAAQLALRT